MILPAPFVTLDLIALTALLVTALALGWIVDHPPKRYPSVTVLMTAYRREWMRQFVTRQPRIFDATVLDSLRQGTAFFASACMIILGGGLAAIGNTERLNMVAADLTLEAEGHVLEIKIILFLIFIANALLKFIWSHRLFGYCAIVMAAVPNEPDDPAAFAGAAKAAELNITAARNFNRGLRSIYFAIGALGWLLGPHVLLLSTFVTAMVMIRREFASESRKLMLPPTQR